MRAIASRQPTTDNRRVGNEKLVTKASSCVAKLHSCFAMLATPWVHYQQKTSQALGYVSSIVYFACRVLLLYIEKGKVKTKVLP